MKRYFIYFTVLKEYESWGCYKGKEKRLAKRSVQTKLDLQDKEREMKDSDKEEREMEDFNILDLMADFYQ